MKSAEARAWWEEARLWDIISMTAVTGPPSAEGAEVSESLGGCPSRLVPRLELGRGSGDGMVMFTAAVSTTASFGQDEFVP